MADSTHPSNSRRTPRGKGKPVQVLSYRHDETRVNNPDVGMVHAGTDPDGDKTTWSHDPHLDPALNFDSARAEIETLIDDALASGDPERMKQALEELKRLQRPYLTWTGKAETTSFMVDTVSLHVHERVDPATILAHAAKRLRGNDAARQWQQPDLFAAPFENLPLRQALEFYRHEKGWANRLVAGDSLLVMNSLLSKESMGGRVQMIYMDPPYGIKYGSNFQPFVHKRDVKDRADQDLTQEPETIKAFRDTWELGIHSYLTYLRDRLLLARELLTESGSVFVQIGDENVHRVRAVMDEVFGESNHVATISFQKTGSTDQALLPQTVDYLLMYAKNKQTVKYRQLFEDRKPGMPSLDRYDLVVELDGTVRRVTKEESLEVYLPDSATRGRLTSLISTRPTGEGDMKSFQFQGQTFAAGRGTFKTNESGMGKLVQSGRLHAPAKTLQYMRRLTDFAPIPIIDR